MAKLPGLQGARTLCALWIICEHAIGFDDMRSWLARFIYRAEVLCAVATRARVL